MAVGTGDRAGADKWNRHNSIFFSQVFFLKFFLKCSKESVDSRKTWQKIWRKGGPTTKLGNGSFDPAPLSSLNA